MQSFPISPINFRNTLGVPWLGITALQTRLQLGSLCHRPSALQSKENDEAAQQPITDESPAIEVVNEPTTTKATPENMQGAVQEKVFYCSSFIFNLLHFNIFFSPLFKQGQSLRRADVHVSQP